MNDLIKKAQCFVHKEKINYLNITISQIIKNQQNTTENQI